MSEWAGSVWDKEGLIIPHAGVCCVFRAIGSGILVTWDESRYRGRQQMLSTSALLRLRLLHSHPGSRSQVTSTAISTSNFTFSAGWGSAAALNFATGNFAAAAVQINASGSGISANPTLTFTFPTAEQGLSAPFIQFCRQVGTTGNSGFWLITNLTASSVTWSFIGTPSLIRVRVLQIPATVLQSVKGPSTEAA